MGMVEVFLCWGLLLTATIAEKEYFPHSTNKTWDNARTHCQNCFEDLVTLTADNIWAIVRMIRSEHWVGLRKYFPNINATNASWIQWCNGDPVAFQNWYPGMPVAEDPLPNIDCCSCSCTCPAPPTTITTVTTPSTKTLSPRVLKNVIDPTNYDNYTSMRPNDSIATKTSTTSYDFTTSQPWRSSQNSNPFAGSAYSRTRTSSPISSTCERSPMLPPIVPETNKKYIDDSCVVMLQSGLWMERRCTQSLPFICHEDKFYGKLDVTDITATMVTLNWDKAPGNISHYILTVTGAAEFKFSLNALTKTLTNLTAGALYRAQVDPVKCNRNLNAQTASFYTIPHKVNDLKVNRTTETSVFLSWSEPEGKVDLYEVETENLRKEVNTTELEFEGLTPGKCYTFRVRSGVEDKSRWSETSFIPACTRPAKVSNLKAGEVTDTTVKITWNKPEGEFRSFKVKVMSSAKNFSENTTNNGVYLTGLTSGTKITVQVIVITARHIEGEPVALVTYTAPKPVINLKLVASNNRIDASWDFIGDNSLSFSAELMLENDVIQKTTATEDKVSFDKLKTATYYTVFVSAVSGELHSPAVNESVFTLPNPPSNPKVTFNSIDQIHLTWDAPEGITYGTYVVNVTSFWRDNRIIIVQDVTSLELKNLTSGTKYKVEIRTKAGEIHSEPATCTRETVANEMEISLSMLCSSPVPLLCGNSAVKESVIKEMEKAINDTLHDNVFWKLSK